MPRLSIIIPVVGDPTQMDDTLVSVLENRPADCEILVVHNRPYRDPYNLGDEVRFVEAPPGAGVAECLNQGVAASRSAVIHALACGVEVCSGWADAGLRHFRDPAIAAVAAVLVDRDNGQKILSAGLGYRTEGTEWRLGRPCRPEGVAACLQHLCGPDTLAAFYRKSAIEAVGGFPSWTSGAMMGIDLALALQQTGLRCVLEPQCVAGARAEMVRPQPAFRYGRNAERLFWRWASSHGWLASLASHLALLAGLCVVSLWRPSRLIELVGRVCGVIQTALGRNGRRPHVAVSPLSTAIGKPHFELARQQQKQRGSARVA